MPPVTKPPISKIEASPEGLAAARAAMQVKTVPREKPPNPGGVVGALVICLAFGAFGARFLLPRSKPAPAGAYVDAARGFAVTPPAGWTTISRDNFAALAAAVRDKLPAGLPWPTRENGPVVMFLKTDAEGFAPSLNVVMVEGQVPPLNEKTRAEGTDIVGRGLRSVLPSYKVETSRIDRVDDLAALRIGGAARLRTERRVPAPPPAPGARPGRSTVVREEVAVTVTQVLVPGRERGYILSATTADADLAAQQPVLEKAIASFTVLERPHALGPILRGTLGGGVIGGLAFSLLFLVRSLAYHWTSLRR